MTGFPLLVLVYVWHLVWPFALAVGTLGAVAAISALVPASRAARVNPTAALRED